MVVDNLEAKYLRFNGGLNDIDSTITVSDSEVVSGQNFEIDGDKFRVRNGCTKLNSTAAGSQRFQGLFYVNPAGTEYLVGMTTAGDIRIMDYSGSGGYPDGTWNTAVNTGLDTAAATRWDCSTLQIGATDGNIFVCNGVNAPYYGACTGALTSLHSTDGDAPDVAKYTEIFANRVFFGNITLAGTANPLAIQWSNAGAGTTWTATDYKVFARESREITGLKTFRGSLFVFCKVGIHKVTYTGSATTPFVFEEFIIKDIGCASRWSIVEVHGLLIFLGTDKRFHAFNGCNEVPISDKITTLMETLNESYLHLVEGKYYPKNEQIVFTCNTGATAYNDTIITGDVRGFSPGSTIVRWNPKYIPAVGYSRLAIIYYNGQQELLAGDALATGFAYRLDTGTDDAGTSITANFTTKDYPIGSLGRKFDSVYLDVWLKGQTGTSNITVDFYIDGSATSSATLTLSQTSTQTLFNVSDDVYGTVNGKTVKMTFANSSGSLSTIYTVGLLARLGQPIF